MSGYFYREEQRGVPDTRELPLPHSAAAEEMFAAIDAVFGSVQTRDCLATSTFDDGIDMPFSDQPAVGGKGYMPPFCAYKSGGKIRVSPGRVNGYMATLNGSALNSNPPPEIDGFAGSLYLKCSVGGGAEIVSAAGSDSQTEGYIKLADISESGEIENYLHTYINTKNCGSAWVYWAC